MHCSLRQEFVGDGLTLTAHDIGDRGGNPSQYGREQKVESYVNCLSGRRSEELKMAVDMDKCHMRGFSCIRISFLTTRHFGICLHDHHAFVHFELC